MQHSIVTWLRGKARPDPQLSDQRGRRVMFVSHCLLNENTRYTGGAFAPGAIPAVIDYCLSADAGIVQLPCPEQRVWGGVLKRWMWLAVAVGRRTPFALRRPMIGLLVAYTRFRYRQIARGVARQIHDYASSGFTVVGVIGVDGSPSCGVTTRLDAHATLNAMMDSEQRDQATFNREVILATAQEGSGWFVRSLRAELKRRHLTVAFHSFDLLEEMNGATVVHTGEADSTPLGEPLLEIDRRPCDTPVGEADLSR